MKQIVNPLFKTKVCAELEAGTFTERTMEYRPAAQWLIKELDRRQIPFKVQLLGAGVTKVTTTIDICPTCRRKL
jgi:hypothetical protein